MSNLDLTALAAAARKPVRVQATRVSIKDLSVEDARAKVVIKDTAKVAAEDGSQKLGLTFGKRKVSLDVIAEGAAFFLATAEQVEGFTEQLQGAIDSGMFDDEIAKLQEEMRNPPVKGPKVVAPTENPVDLDALDAATDVEYGVEDAGTEEAADDLL